jgi:hypothetical protein
MAASSDPDSRSGEDRISATPAAARNSSQPAEPPKTGWRSALPTAGCVLPLIGVALAATAAFFAVLVTNYISVRNELDAAKHQLEAQGHAQEEFRTNIGRIDDFLASRLSINDADVLDSLCYAARGTYLGTICIIDVKRAGSHNRSIVLRYQPYRVGPASGLRPP